MKVLFVASEMEPLAKTGGLADVIGVLPKKLRETGCDVRVVLPYYRDVRKNLKKLKYKTADTKIDITVVIDWLSYKADIIETEVEGVKVYLLSNEEFFDRKYIYTAPAGDYKDNDVRFGFYSLGALETAKALNFKPDIIHCNDWQAAMVPIALKWKRHYNDDPFFKSSKLVFTIHNISYQGLFGPEFLDKFGLDRSLFNPAQLEFYGKVNLLKGGIIASDMVTTVSPTYAKEIQTPEYGYGLDGVLREISIQGKLKGIINGIDYDDWNPETDGALFANYSRDDPGGKIENKAKLKSHLGLNSNNGTPLIGVVARLAQQKGIDLVVESLDRLMSLDVELVVLGAGDKTYEKLLTAAIKKYGGHFKAIIGYDEAKARRIYAGCDMFLMPSRFEPCGLGQLISLRYGTIPIVRATGGLLDTIIDYSADRRYGNGFVFDEFDQDELISAVEQAISIYNNTREWNRLVKSAMEMDFSWRKSSREYLKCYKGLLQK